MLAEMSVSIESTTSAFPTFLPDQTHNQPPYLLPTCITENTTMLAEMSASIESTTNVTPTGAAVSWFGSSRSPWGMKRTRARLEKLPKNMHWSTSTCIARRKK
jgi:hypothetical protein